MRIDFTINNGGDAAARYLTWAPSPLRLRLLDATPGPDVVATLSEDRQPNGGSIRFCATPDGNFTPTLKVPLPASGASVTVYVRGKFGTPSQADGDVSIVVGGPASELGRLPVMVRVRKNANQLTPAERDRFISAMAQINNRGRGGSPISATCTSRAVPISRPMAAPASCRGTGPICSTWSASCRPSTPR